MPAYRLAVLLIAGDKIREQPAAPDRWYDKAIRQAEELYQIYLIERAEEESR